MGFFLNWASLSSRFTCASWQTTGCYGKWRLGAADQRLCFVGSPGSTNQLHSTPTGADAVLHFVKDSMDNASHSSLPYATATYNLFLTAKACTGCTRATNGRCLEHTVDTMVEQIAAADKRSICLEPDHPLWRSRHHTRYGRW